VCTLRFYMAVGVMAAFRSTVFDSTLRRCTALFPVSSSFDRVAPVSRPLGTFHQLPCRRFDIVSAKQAPSQLTVGGCAADVATAIRMSAFPFRGVLQIRNFSQSYRMKATHFYCLRLSPDPQVVTLRFAKNGCAPMRGVSRASYRAMCGEMCLQPKHTSTRPRLEYKRVEPAHCPTGAAFGGKYGDITLGIPPFLFYARAPCRLHDWDAKTLLGFIAIVLISTSSCWAFVPQPSAFAIKGPSTILDETPMKPIVPPHTSILS
jgi:hypothetical protein